MAQIADMQRRADELSRKLNVEIPVLAEDVVPPVEPEKAFASAANPAGTFGQIASAMTTAGFFADHKTDVANVNAGIRDFYKNQHGIPPEQVEAMNTAMKVVTSDTYRVRNLQGELRRAEGQVESLEGDQKRAKARLNEVSAQIRVLENRLEEIIVEIRQTNAKLEQAKIDKRKKELIAEDYARTVRSNNNNADYTRDRDERRTYERRADEARYEQRKYEGQAGEFTQVVKESEKHIAELREEERQKSMKNDNLRQERQELGRKMTEYRARLSRAHGEVERIRRQLQQLETAG